MKRTLVMFAAALAGMITVRVSAATAPTCSNISMTEKDGTKSLIVSYDLSADAIVTLAFETNGIALPPAMCTDVGGNVNRYVRGGTGRQIVWRPDRLQGLVDIRDVKPVLTVWPLDVPPPYMVVQLDHASNVTYYASADYVPDGVGNVRYKTTHMVFAKVPAAGRTWAMGNVVSDQGTARREIQHSVTFTYDYYMAIYECTGGQWLQFKTSNPTVTDLTKKFAHPYKDDLRVVPVSSTRVSDVRSDGNFASGPTTNSYVGLMRTRTGLAVDLPTHSEWEVAARAGCSGRMNAPDTPMAELAWTKTNWKNDPKVAAGLYTTNQTHEVGLLKPNAFGLYDMIGNVLEQGREWLFDSTVDYIATFGDGATQANYLDTVWVNPAYYEKSITVDGTTYTADGNNSGRWGGSFDETDGNGITPSRWAAYGHYGQYDTGFRLMCPVVNGGRLN